MVKTFAVLLGYQCLGELVAYVANIPIPGAVIGMLLLLASLARVPRIATTIESDSLAFLKVLPLLFVPAGVGVMVFSDRIAQELLPIVVSVLVSTALTIVVTALVGRSLADLLSIAKPTVSALTSAQVPVDRALSSQSDDSKGGPR